nr:RHS repeat-associated core domain-containing protein [Paraburkholderia caribensis]
MSKVVGNLLKEYAGAHYEYDARGNLVAKQSPGSEQRYEWDEFNRLGAVSVRSSAGARQAKYFYDAFGRRIAKDVDGAKTVFGWDGDRLAYEVAGSQSTHYVYEAGSFVPLAQFVAAPVEGLETPQRRESDRYTPEDDPLMKVSTPNGLAQVYYYHCDVIGTPQMLTDDAGEIVWEARYKAWGEAAEVIARVSAATQAQVRNPIRFQGQQADDETGLHYNRHRYYDPHAGRFVSKDPIGLAGGINVYQYASNPVGWVDPLGLATCPLQKLADRGFSGVIKNDNGGLDYSGSNALYDKNGVNPIQTITYSGDYGTDFQNASMSALGQKSTPRGYVWHHVDNYNPETNTGTMQLVKQEAHTGIQHAGGVSQYQAATGQPYTHPCRR